MISLGLGAGFLMGLVEGAGLLGLNWLGWLAWTAGKESAVSPEVIWAAAIAGTVVGLTAAALVVAASRLVPALPAWKALVFVLAALTFFDWIGMTGRIERTPAALFAMGLASVVTRFSAARESALPAFALRSGRWGLALLVATVGAVQGGLWVSEAAAESRLPAAAAGAPNVLVLVIDTARADHLSSYGYARPTTPRIDRFATEGVLFDEAYAGSSWTLPSHASLLTGRYLYEHGTEWNTRFDERWPTLGEAFAARGYRTGAISANLNFFTRRLGFGRGFIHFEDYFHSVADVARRSFYARQVEGLLLPRLERLGIAGLDDYPARKRADDVSSSLIAWMGASRARPFFAFANYFDLHDPYTPPQPWRSRFAPAGSTPGGIINSRIRHPDERELTTAELESEQEGYDGALAFVDHEIGRVLDWLDAENLSDRTIVIVTSDHGESFGEHGLVEHRNALFREVIRVPLVIRWPGRVPARTRVARPVTNVALAATLLEMTGAADSRFPGPALAALWSGGPAPAPDGWPLPLAEIARQPFEPYKKRPVYSGSLRSVVSPAWQYVEHSARGPSVVPGPERLSGQGPEPPAGDSDRAVRELGAYMAGHYPAPPGGLGGIQPDE